MNSMDPIILGRFNYLSYRPDLYNVVFFPFHGTVASIVAKNLSKEDALAMIQEFNETIDNTRKELENWQSGEEDDF